MNNTHTFIFFGIVGSGKGTQVKLLGKYLKEKNISNDIVLISTGDEYRRLIKSGNYTSQLIKETSKKGILQPDFLTISLFINTLTSSLKENSFIITDGFPRTIIQSEALDSAMGFYHRSDIDIIYIDLSKDKAIKRMKLRKRYDDTDEGIAQRLEEYVNNVIPSLNYFKNKKKYTIHKINGNQTVEMVYADIIKALNL